MIKTDIEKTLTPKEYALVLGLREGKTLRQIAVDFQSADSSVRSLKHRLKKKLGENRFNSFIQKECNVFVQNRGPGGTLSFFSIEYLKNLLSPLELEIFILKKIGEDNHSKIANVVGTRADSMDIHISRIEKKLEGHCHELISPHFTIEGMGTFHDREKVKRDCCFNCIHYKGFVSSSKKIKIYCNGLTQTYFKNKKNCYCKLYSRYMPIHKKQERDLLEEKLQDEGYLEMVYNLAQGYEPTCPFEKTQYAIANLAFQSYHFKKKAQHFALMAKSSRYAVVSITSKERKDPDVKQILEHLKLSPSKIDFEVNEEGELYSVARYIIKDQRSFKTLSVALLGNIEISILDKKSIGIDFQEEVSLSSIYITPPQKQKSLPLDRENSNPSFRHIVKYSCVPGKHILRFTMGEKRKYSRNNQTELSFAYEIDIVENNGFQIGSCKLL